MSTTSERSRRDPPGVPGISAVEPIAQRPSFALRRERWLPWIFFVLAFGAVCLFPPLWLLKAEWKPEILTDVVAASAILAAYLLTAATVLPAVEDKIIVQKFRRWQYYGFIVDYIGRAIQATSLLLVLSLIAIPLPSLISAIGVLKTRADLINQGFSALWWSTAVLSVGFVYVATRTLLKLLRAR